MPVGCWRSGWTLVLMFACTNVVWHSQNKDVPHLLSWLEAWLCNVYCSTPLIGINNGKCYSFKSLSLGIVLKWKLLQQGRMDPISSRHSVSSLLYVKPRLIFNRLRKAHIKMAINLSHSTSGWGRRTLTVLRSMYITLDIHDWLLSPAVPPPFFFYLTLYSAPEFFV